MSLVAGLALMAAGGIGLWYAQPALNDFDPAIWRAGENAPFDTDAPRLRMASGW
jgi:hypothetical protein